MRSHGRAGFALIDMLVALAVAGLIATSLTGLVAFSMQQMTRVQEAKNESEKIAAAGRVLRALLEGVSSFPAGDSRQPAIRGSATSLQLWSLGSPVLALGSPVLFSLNVEKRDNGNALAMRWFVQEQGMRSEIIISDLSELTFEYFLMSAEDKATFKGWTSSLPKPPYHIQAVKMKLRLQPRHAETEFIYPVLASMPLSCTANEGRFGCP